MKSRLVPGGLFLIGVLVSVPAMSAEYHIDIPGQHASVTFKASHLGYSFIVGRFNDFDGKFSYDANNLSASRAVVTIQTRSLDTNHAERDRTLRNTDFLDVGNHPTITFESTSYASEADGDKLKGNLTMLGVTREIEIDVRKIGEGKDPWGGYRSGFEGNVTLNAADYGLPEWVGNLEVELNIEGVRK